MHANGHGGAVGSESGLLLHKPTLFHLGPTAPSHPPKSAHPPLQGRNLGLPVELAGRYFEEGADEVTFLNITGFRDFPLGDLPMLEVLRRASEGVFVPLTVGGGIREFTDASGKHYSALQVAAEYFRCGGGGREHAHGWLGSVWLSGRIQQPAYSQHPS